MSVVVKGMKMPESCGACKLSAQVSMSLGAVMRCRLLGVVGTSSSDPYDVLNKRHPNCPLVALPNKHGRLVDADAFKVCLRNALKQTRNAYSDKGEWAETITEQFCDAIDDQLTIVESEDES